MRKIGSIINIKRGAILPSRTKNAVRNSFYGIVSRISGLLISFISRTVFIYTLGSTYLGINGLYSELLTLLSFAELGFGSAMTFALYDPVAKNDHDRIVKLLDFYKKIYRIIALVIAGIGIALVPFLQHIVKGADWLSIAQLRQYYLIFLLNTVISYFISYKFSYLNALQKNYIHINIEAIVTAICAIAQILVVVISKNFFAYLLINSILLTVSRFVIAYYLNRQYPILKERPEKPLNKDEQKPIFNEVKGLVVHQFASVAVHSTDNIIISSLSGLGVVAVGVISNYNMLMNAILSFVKIVFNSVTSGFGNIVAASSTENFHKVFREVDFLSSWIYGFCAIAFWILLPPFITLWIGAENLIDSTSFLLIVINGYLQGQSTTYNNARIAKGDFSRDKLWALAQALVNLVVSVVGAKELGLVGVYIGTVASRLVYVLFRPFSTYQFLFGRHVKEYYLQIALQIVAVLAAGLLTYWTTYKLLQEVSPGSFLIASSIVLVLPNLFFWIVYCRSREFKSWENRILQIIQRNG